MKTLQIYATGSHFSVTIDSGVKRDVSGSRIDAVVNGMDATDRLRLRTFCACIVALCDGEPIVAETIATVTTALAKAVR